MPQKGNKVVMICLLIRDLRQKRPKRLFRIHQTQNMGNWAKSRCSVNPPYSGLTNERVKQEYRIFESHRRHMRLLIRHPHRQDKWKVK